MIPGDSPKNYSTVLFAESVRRATCDVPRAACHVRRATCDVL